MTFLPYVPGADSLAAGAETGADADGVSGPGSTRGIIDCKTSCGRPDVLIDPCLYRKPKPERSGDEVRQGARVIECFRSAEWGERPVYLYARTSGF